MNNLISDVELGSIGDKTWHLKSEADTKEEY